MGFRVYENGKEVKYGSFPGRNYLLTEGKEYVFDTLNEANHFANHWACRGMDTGKRSIDFKLNTPVSFSIGNCDPLGLFGATVVQIEIRSDSESNF